MSIVLSADWHLTSNIQHEDRWHVFDAIEALASRHKAVIVAGDITDRRDRHDSNLVNRLVRRLTYLTEHYGMECILISGNHDRPLPDAKLPYWHFLNEIENIRFISQPYVHARWPRLLLLPYADNPEDAWQSIDFSLYEAAICHMPAKQVGNYITLVKQLPPLVYSGDEHAASVIDTVQYIGSPSFINFGDDYPCRMLLLSDRDFSIQEEIRLRPPSKHMLDISSAEELTRARVNRGDAAKVRLVMPADRIGEWGQEQARIADWARRSGVSLASVEPVVEVPLTAEDAPAGLTEPLDGLFAFADAQGMDPELLRVGVELVEQAKGA